MMAGMKGLSKTLMDVGQTCNMKKAKGDCTGDCTWKKDGDKEVCEPSNDVMFVKMGEACPAFKTCYAAKTEGECSTSLATLQPAPRRSHPHSRHPARPCPLPAHK